MNLLNRKIFNDILLFIFIYSTLTLSSVLLNSIFIRNASLNIAVIVIATLLALKFRAIKDNKKEAFLLSITGGGCAIAYLTLFARYFDDFAPLTITEYVVSFSFNAGVIYLVIFLLAKKRSPRS